MVCWQRTVAGPGSGRAWGSIQNRSGLRACAWCGRPWCRVSPCLRQVAVRLKPGPGEGWPWPLKSAVHRTVLSATTATASLSNRRSSPAREQCTVPVPVAVLPRPGRLTTSASLRPARFTAADRARDAEAGIRSPMARATSPWRQSGPTGTGSGARTSRNGCRSATGAGSRVTSSRSGGADESLPGKYRFRRATGRL